MTEITPGRWRRISSLFDEAVSLPPDERAAYVDAQCGGDADLKERVMALLEAADGDGEIIDKPIFSEAGPLVREVAEQIRGDQDEPLRDEGSMIPTLPVDAAAEGGEIVGPYRLLQKIGEGGMGEVWLAEQAEPVRRRVALKIIKAGLDTRQVVARFEAERQALAMMDHPAIAKVFDAGVTSRGLPYFTMEYVAGEPITSYCDRHLLGTRERLELFAQVCEGVQHAHQKGVIHRDLKPSNVLVAVVGERPAPKIIDFGVAKATAQRLTERTLFTELGVLIGTPEYMSPEQAEMTGLDVDTRSDVYALGVMLYELITGVLPFDPAALRRLGYDEIRRRIREDEPPRPSTRVKTLGDRATDAARKRRTDPLRLVSRLRGDLDWIVMKALEKDRTRRYGAPSDLASDLARHLAHEPVLAGPPGTAYRARKFIRRHRFGVTAAAVAMVALAGFSVSMAVQARRIARERDRAERVSEFLVELFRVSDPSEARGNTVTAREVLDRGALKIEKDLSEEPLVQSQLMETMGRVYQQLGLWSEAERLMRESAEVRDGTLGPEDPLSLRSRHGLVLALDRLGQYEEAERIVRKVLDARRRVLGDEHPDTLASLDYLGVLHERQARIEEAGRVYRSVLEARLRVLGDDHADTVWSKNNVASNLEDSGDLAESEKLFREVAEWRLRRLGEDHPLAIESRKNHARLLGRLARRGEAEEILREVIDAQRRVLGGDHPATYASVSELMAVLGGQGRIVEAEGLYRNMIEARIRLGGPDHPGVFATMYNMGVVYLEANALEEAEGQFREAYAGLRRVKGESNGTTQGAAYNLACVLARRGKNAEAIEFLEKLLASGFTNPADVARDPDLQGLRGDPAFERLVGAASSAPGEPADAPH